MTYSFLSSLSKDWNPSSLLGRLLPPISPPAPSEPPAPAFSSLAPVEDFPRSDPDLSPELRTLRLAFDHFDANRDGNISRDELRLSLNMFDISVDDAELNAMLDGADGNTDGVLDFSEFVDFYYSLSEERGLKFQAGLHDPSQDEAGLSDAFQVFDKDGDGFICAEELHSVLKSMGLKPGCKLVDCRNMIHNVDVDGDGQVNFDEFKRMMTVGFGNS